MARPKAARTSSNIRTKTAKAPSRSAKTASRSAVAEKKPSKKARPASEAKAETSVSDREVTIDRRRPDAPQTDLASADNTAPAAPKLERRQKVNRRRQIDPTTCERDYTDQEVEFMTAIDEYKRKNGRMFPTCSEVLEVVRGLGYVKMTTPMSAMQEMASNAPIFEASDASVKEAISPLNTSF
jgi:hypothetical protein